MGVWIFATAFVIVVVYLSLRSRRFIRWLGYGVAGCSIALLGLMMLSHYERTKLSERRKLALSMIDKSEIASVLSLNRGRTNWELTGNVENNSNYPVLGFAMRIVVYGCQNKNNGSNSNFEKLLSEVDSNSARVSSPDFPDFPDFRPKKPVGDADLINVPGGCSMIGGDDVVQSSLPIPAHQVRRLETSFTFRDMPLSRRWDWAYAIVSVEASIE